MILYSKGKAQTIVFPMLDATAPESFLTGATVTLTGYAQTAPGGAFSAVALGASAAEIGATGLYVFTLSAAAAEYAGWVVKATATGAADTALRLVSTDALLDADLGLAVPLLGSLREALMAARAHACGTRETAAGVESIRTPDRSTQLRARRLEPVGGPYTRLREVGNHVIRCPLGEVEIDEFEPWLGRLIDVPLDEVEIDDFPATTPYQAPRDEIEMDDLLPSVFWE